MTNQVDVFICDSGSAGLCAATWLARCRVNCKIVDSRFGPLEIEQADGVQTRTTEIFESFDIVDGLLREGYHIVETAFWNACGKGGGTAWTRSVPASYPGLSHMPRLVLDQARLHSILLEAMNSFNGQKVDYGYKVLDVKVDKEKANDPNAYAVTIKTEKDGKEETFEAKYALICFMSYARLSMALWNAPLTSKTQGCDDAHSTVRKSLGFKMIGDSSDAVWGVVDFIARTKFPDIRKITVLQSESGTLLNIPREGGSMNRFYMELPHGKVAKEVKLEDLETLARRISTRTRLNSQKQFGGRLMGSGNVLQIILRSLVESS